MAKCLPRLTAIVLCGTLSTAMAGGFCYMPCSPSFEMVMLLYQCRCGTSSTERRTLV